MAHINPFSPEMKGLIDKQASILNKLIEKWIVDDQPFVLVSEHAVKDKLYSALLNYKVSFMDSISYSKYLQRVQSELRQKHYQKKEHYKLLAQHWKTCVEWRSPYCNATGCHMDMTFKLMIISQIL